VAVEKLIIAYVSNSKQFWSRSIPTNHIKEDEEAKKAL
jgi:hypothetical protein